MYHAVRKFPAESYLLPRYPSSCYDLCLHRDFPRAEIPFLTYADASQPKWMMYFTRSLFLIGIGYFTLRLLHSISFTPEGLIFFRFGMEYRRLPWNQIQQIGVAKEYNASRLSIAITPENCPRYEGGSITAYVERYRFKLVLLDATKENIAAIKHFYGNWDYQTNTFRQL